MKTTKSRIFSDLFWYILGSIIPLLVGLLRTPVFTRYFTPEEYGYYGLVFITYSVVSIFLYSWLTNCVWRFYNFYKKESKLDQFYANLFFLFLCFTVVFLLIIIGWCAFPASIITKKLTVLVFIQLFISSPLNYILIVFRLENKSEKYNLIQIIRAILGFSVQYIMTFRLHFRIESIPVASIIIDFVILIFVLSPLIKSGSLSFLKLSIKVIRNLFSFAIPGIISNLTLFILVLSDRYMIAYFGNIAEVGIYNQVYNLSQVTIMALVNIFFAVINPSYLKELEYNFKGTIRLTQNYLYVFIISILPITVYLSLFSHQFATILLGSDFLVGYTIIPWVMFSSFIYGMTLFSENRLKFNSQYNQIIIGFLLSASLNIILNFIFIPVYSYKFAAVSTLISYIILFIYLLVLDIRINKFQISGWQTLIPAVITLSIQIIVDTVIKSSIEIENELGWAIFETIVFCFIYIIVIYTYSSRSILLLIKSFKTNSH